MLFAYVYMILLVYMLALAGQKAGQTLLNFLVCPKKKW